MATISKKNTKETIIVKQESNEPLTAAAVLANAELTRVPIGLIDYSPINYRKFYDEDALQDFAGELAIHGIIQPILLRPKAKGRYELVVGERRIRGAHIAKLLDAPAGIAVLTDSQVREIQLAENFQRENPHPMNDAKALGEMLAAGLTIDQIAKRLGKPAPFIALRIRLLNLIEPIQEMYFKDVFKFGEVTEIALLSEASQQEFFDQHCSKWQQAKKFRINDLSYILSRFKYDLKKAPFNTKDKNLLPEVGACTACPHNSATLKSLFPDEAKTAHCTNRNCYQDKCVASLLFSLKTVFSKHQPQAILYFNALGEKGEALLHMVEGAAELPRHYMYDVEQVQPPQVPNKDLYYDEPDIDDDEGEDDEAGEGAIREVVQPVFDEAMYQSAMQDYEEEKKEYEEAVASGTIMTGVLIRESGVELLQFRKERSKPKAKGEVTAKEVQEAIKAGTVTPELLQAEITRLQTREARQKELDRDKIHTEVHTAFHVFAQEPANNTGLTKADLAGIALVIASTLDYSLRDIVINTLYAGKEKPEDVSATAFKYEVFAGLTEAQLTYLVRMAVVGKSDSKYTTAPHAYFMRAMAGAAGIDIAAIETAQADKATQREDKMNLRIKEISQRIARLEKMPELRAQLDEA